MKTLLLVDDTEIFRETIAEFLEEQGFLVVQANSGQAALNLLSSTLDYIITDLNMDGMSGLELAREVRKTLKIPIYLCSAEPKAELLIGDIPNMYFADKTMKGILSIVSKLLNP